MSPRPFAPRIASGGQGQMGFYILLDLVYPGGIVSKEESGSRWLTFVTLVPPKKKTTKRAKKTFQGCMACTIAVNIPVKMPAGVNELRDHARHASINVAGTAMYGCIVPRYQYAIDVQYRALIVRDNLSSSLVGV